MTGYRLAAARLRLVVYNVIVLKTARLDVKCTIINSMCHPTPPRPSLAVHMTCKNRLRPIMRLAGVER